MIYLNNISSHVNIYVKRFRVPVSTTLNICYVSILQQMYICLQSINNEIYIILCECHFFLQELSEDQI